MDPEVQAFAQVMAVLVPSIVVLATVAMVLYRMVHRTSLPAKSEPSRISDDRFERLEQAVDSIAIEVERISESQRFAAKLLAERNSESVVERGPRRTADP